MKSKPSLSSGQYMIYSGIGVPDYFIRDEGRFQVRYIGGIKEFSNLLHAYLFYQPLIMDASIWDMTEEPILVEEKTVVDS